MVLLCSSQVFVHQDRGADNPISSTLTLSIPLLKVCSFTHLDLFRYVSTYNFPCKKISISWCLNQFLSRHCCSDLQRVCWKHACLSVDSDFVSNLHDSTFIPVIFQLGDLAAQQCFSLQLSLYLYVL